MMKAIFSIILVCFLAVVVSTASAVNNGFRDVRKYQNELKLTPQQMVQLNAIYSNLDNNVKLQNPGGTFEQKAAQIQQNHRQKQIAIRNVMTPEQRKQYRAILGIQPHKKVKK
jgi:hypothetical protein